MFSLARILDKCQYFSSVRYVNDIPMALWVDNETTLNLGQIFMTIRTDFEALPRF